LINVLENTVNWMATLISFARHDDDRVIASAVGTRQSRQRRYF